MPPLAERTITTETGPRAKVQQQTSGERWQRTTGECWVTETCCSILNTDFSKLAWFIVIADTKLFLSGLAGQEQEQYDYCGPWTFYIWFIFMKQQNTTKGTGMFCLVSAKQWREVCAVSKVGRSPDPLCLHVSLCVCSRWGSLMPWGNSIIVTNPPRGPKVLQPLNKLTSARFDFKGQCRTGRVLDSFEKREADDCDLLTDPGKKKKN